MDTDGRVCRNKRRSEMSKGTRCGHQSLRGIPCGRRDIIRRWILAADASTPPSELHGESREASEKYPEHTSEKSTFVAVTAAMLNIHVFEERPGRASRYFARRTGWQGGNSQENRVRRKCQNKREENPLEALAERIRLIQPITPIKGRSLY